MMVLAILLETTYPILLLRRCSTIFSAMGYFFSDLVFDAVARDLLAVPLALAALPAAFLAGAAVAGAAFASAVFCTAAFFCPAPLRPMPSSRSRKIVLTRAISLRRPRIFFRLSVWPMFIWNLSLKSW